MLSRKERLFKYIQTHSYGVVAGLIIAFAVLFRVVLIACTYPEVNSDEGTMGIEAMHIAFQGARPVYLYGQNYMGVLEAYLAAPFMHLFGISPFTLRLSMLLLFACFLVVMYWLGSLLYSKRLALVSLVLLSLATADMLIQQLRAVGGAIETVLFGSLMLVLAYQLAVMVETRSRWRYLLYLAWGWTAGIALWVHFLSLPFIICSALLIIVFCWRDWRSLALPSLLIGFCIGGFLLIQNYQIVLDTVLKIRSGGTVTGVSTYPAQQVISALFWGIPLTTGLQPVCDSTQIISYSNFSLSTLPCNVVQGAWGAGYIVLLVVGMFMAGAICWRLWRRRLIEQVALDPQSRREQVLNFARLMLLCSAVLVILFYISSPLSGEKPWSTRYLVGLLVATPAVLWPLWRLTGLEYVQPLSRKGFQWFSRGAIILILLTWLSGTLYTLTLVPAAMADTQQQNQLVQDLHHLNVKHVYVEYWTCYRLLFQSQEQILCASPAPLVPALGADRYAPDARIVRNDPNASYMFPSANHQAVATFEHYMYTSGRAYTRHDLDGMTLFIPAP